MAEINTSIKGEIALIETRTTKQGRYMAYLWVRVLGIEELQPVVVFPSGYEPLAGIIKIGSQVQVEGIRGTGPYHDVLYADRIKQA